ncbi:MAG TPA: hypothetical protein VJ720_06685, partial [Chitinophaga sp.]|nr:hypothetical protein [Chitinophaga sp.]
MFMQYLSFTLFACLISIHTSPDNAAAQEKWVITKGCSLRVNGNTNVNKFSCVIDGYTNPDTLKLCEKNGTVFLSGTIGLP